MAQSVSLSGTLIVDLSGQDLYDNQIIDLVDAASISGVWEGVSVSGSYSECIGVSATPIYQENRISLQINVVELCSDVLCNSLAAALLCL